MIPVFGAILFGTGPDGQGVNPVHTKTVFVPAGQAFKITVNYSAEKEVRAQICYRENDEMLATASNDPRQWGNRANL